MPLTDKRALVTGSTSGIGMGIAESLAQAGARVIIHGFAHADHIAELSASLKRRRNVEVEYLATDVSDAQAMVQDLGALGPVDILVNNAGIQHTSPVKAFELEHWNSVLAVNLTAAFLTIRALLPAMRQKGWGRIVNIASVHGLVASKDKAAYVAAKHGLLGLTKVVALETATSGITCNAICPGWVLTPLVQGQIDARAAREGISVEQAGAELLKEKQPSGRFALPEEIGALVVYLCSEMAGSMTGSSLPIDGGWVAQ